MCNLYMVKQKPVYTLYTYIPHKLYYYKYIDHAMSISYSIIMNTDERRNE